MLPARLSNLVKSLTLASCLLILSACSDSGGSDDGETTIAAGYFLDSAVGNIRYESTDHSGWTDRSGYFPYTPGQTVTLSYDGLTLGTFISSQNSAVITPATILGESNPESASSLSQSAKNLLVLLQSMDEDQNLDNGIYLISSREDPEANQTPLASLDLTADPADFSTALQTVIDSDFAGRDIAIVDETAAIEHFQGTLAKLSAAATFEGRWIARNGEYGDVSAIYDFNANGEVTVTEYDDCSNNDIYWSSTVESTDSNCTTRPTFTQSYTLVGNALSLTGSDISDSCIVVSSSEFEVIASCIYQGVNEVETTIFQKDNTAFSETTVVGKYKEIFTGANGIFGTTEFTKATDGTKGGGYRADVFTPGQGDEGTFDTWTVAGDGQTISYSGTDDSGTEENPGTFSGTYNFDAFLTGSWIDNTSTEPVILRNVKANSNVNTIADIDGFHGIYDAKTGVCKGVMRKDDIDPNSTTYDVYDSAASSNLICDYPSNWSEITPDNTYSVTASNGVLELTENATSKWCVLLHTQIGGTIKYVACSTNASTAFDLEIWRQL